MGVIILVPWFFTLYLETLAREDLLSIARSGIGTCCALGLSNHSLAAFPACPSSCQAALCLLGEMDVVLPTLPLLKLLGILSTRSQSSGLASGTHWRSEHPSRYSDIAGLVLSRQERQFGVKICEKLNSLTEES